METRRKPFFEEKCIKHIHRPRTQNVKKKGKDSYFPYLSSHVGSPFQKGESRILASQADVYKGRILHSC